MAEAYAKPSLPAKERPGAFWAEALLGLLVILAALGCLFLFPESASRVGRELHLGLLLPLVLCVLASCALQIRGVQFPAWSFALVAGFFLLQLWWLWRSGASDTMLIGGFLPFSDASDYMVNAQVLAGGERIQGQGHANDHLLTSAMLAVLWKGAHGDYRLILAFISLLGAASVWLALAEVSLLLGGFAGTVWLLVDILFFRRFIGVPLSEHLGMILGNLGLALGCRAVRVNRGYYWVLATFALALALQARPGAIFTIPALVAGAFLAYPQKGLRRWALPGAMAIAAAGAVLLDKFVSQAVGNQNPNAAISNAVYHLYSLVYGGEWTDAMNRYGNDRPAVWHAVEAQLRAHPFSLFSGGERSLVAIVRQGYLFTFVNAKWLSSILHLAFAAGSVAVVLNLRRDKRAWWLFALLAGLLASMPLLPPWNTDNMRVYAATIPLIAFTAAVGAYAAASPVRAWGLLPDSLRIGSTGNLSVQPAKDGRPSLAWLSTALLAAVVILCVVLPPFFHARVLPFTWSLEDTYRVNRTDGTIPYSPRMALKLVPDSTPPSALALRLADFRAGLGGFARFYPGEAGLLESLPAGCVLLPSFHEFSFMAIDESHVPNSDRDQAINVQVRFIAEGWLLLAVDEALLARSAALAAYDPGAIGAFSFGINRFPVIRAGDTVTLVENVSSVDFIQPARSGPNINSIKPFGVGSRRLRFPVPGEYYLRVNQHYPLKLLVMDRDSTEADSNRLIADFVASNCIAEPDGAARHLGGQTAVDPARFFESEAPVPLSRSSMLQFIADLESCANRSSPK
jgi:hypothetical protein